MSLDASQREKQQPPVVTVKYFDVTKDYRAQLPNCLHRVSARSKFALCDECGGQALWIFYDQVAYAIKCRDHVKQQKI